MTSQGARSATRPLPPIVGKTKSTRGGVLRRCTSARSPVTTRSRNVTPLSRTSRLASSARASGMSIVVFIRVTVPRDPYSRIARGSLWRRAAAIDGGRLARCGIANWPPWSRRSSARGMPRACFAPTSWSPWGTAPPTRRWRTAYLPGRSGRRSVTTSTSQRSGASAGTDRSAAEACCAGWGRSPRGQSSS